MMMLPRKLQAALTIGAAILIFFIFIELFMLPSSNNQDARNSDEEDDNTNGKTNSGTTIAIKKLPADPSVTIEADESNNNNNNKNNNIDHEPTKPQQPSSVEEESVPPPPPPPQKKSSSSTTSNMMKSIKQRRERKMKQLTAVAAAENDDDSNGVYASASSSSNSVLQPPKGMSEPVQCKKSYSLDRSAPMLRKYGPLEHDNWCELISTPADHRLRNNENWIKNYQSVYMNNTDLRSSSSSSKLPRDHFNGSTYVNFLEQDRGDWPYFKCPVKHRIRCGTYNYNKKTTTNNNKKRMKKKTKALVLYATTSSSNIYQHHQEANNFNFFMNNGLIPANTSTALFDAVDFAFIRIQLNHEKTDQKTLDCGNAAEAMLLGANEMNKKKKNNANNDDNNENENSKDNYSNVKFLMAPTAPCDLCAHLHVLDKLSIINIDKEQDAAGRRAQKTKQLSFLDKLFLNASYDEERNEAKGKLADEYSYIVMMNAGIRGPFFNSADDYGGENENTDDHPKTTWIDYVAMAGRRRIPNPRLGFFNDVSIRRKNTKKENKKKTAEVKKQPVESNSTTGTAAEHVADYHEEDEFDCPTHISTSASISWEGALHHQSFLLGLPIELFRKRIFPLFASLCPRKNQGGRNRGGYWDNKYACISLGEVNTGKAVLDYDSPFAMFSLNKQFFVQDTEVDSRVKNGKHSGDSLNPTTGWMNPCRSQFAKMGGEIFDKRLLNHRTMSAVNKLTKGSRGGVDGGGGAGSIIDLDKVQKMLEDRGCDWKI